MSAFPLRRTATALACLHACAAHAQGVATDTTLPQVVIIGQRVTLPADLPNSLSSKTAEDLREQNLFNPEDALNYVSNTTVRKRYLGDRNALVGGRSFGTTQPSRVLVYLDGYLISNFLGRFDAPRWNMVSPEAIARVDLLYGPYSALYPGNSIGTTIAVTQRTPQALELSGRLTGATQDFEQYGRSDRYDSYQASAHLGHRLEGGLWFALDANRQDATSQPMQYYTVSADASGAFPGVGTIVEGTPTAIRGVQYDTDPRGQRRAIFGAHAGAIDHTVQDTLNLRAGYRFTPLLEASAMASFWRNDTEMRNQTYVADASGAPVWQGAAVTVRQGKDETTRYLVRDGAQVFELPPNAFAPSTRDESHRQLGATLKTRNERGWNGSVVVSDYRIVDDTARQAANPDPVAASGGAGTVTRRDGTGWNTFEVQGLWTPFEGDWTGGRHALALGLHRNAYQLDNTVTNASDWRRDSEAAAISQYYRGKTEVTALYVQDAWTLSPDAKLTLGWREERFRAHEGSQLGGGQTVHYAARELSGHSPKASLAYSLNDEWLLKASAGRGVRFPNVEELYNGTVTPTSVSLSDPNLQPETSNALELSAEREERQQRLRVSLFLDDVRDAILRQSDLTVVPSRTYVSNVDRVRTYGVELSYSIDDWLTRGLGFEANAAWAHAQIVANAKDPQSVGQWWPRVPRWRGNLLLGWRPDDRWLASAGYRYESAAYNDTANLDINPNVYGGISRVSQIDLRGSYRWTKALELALGLNNATDSHAYQFHPYPGRTVYAELRFQL